MSRMIRIRIARWWMIIYGETDSLLVDDDNIWRRVARRMTWIRWWWWLVDNQDGMRHLQSKVGIFLVVINLRRRKRALCLDVCPCL